MVDSSGKKKILLVDDNEVQLSVAEIQIKRDYQVTTAKSGKEALEHLFHGLVPDLILLDILMPNMDGWETFGRLRAVSRLQEVPIVFLSSINARAEIRRAFDMGAADFFVKPFNIIEASERIKKVIKKQDQ
jgi:CheY-like chemotaxis protein